MAKRKTQKVPRRPSGNITELGGPRGAPAVPGQNITNPAKEWDILDEDLAMAAKLEKMQVVLGGKIMKMGRERKIFLSLEKKTSASIDMIEEELISVHKAFKDKYKIIGDIVNIDMKRKKIIIM